MFVGSVITFVLSSNVFATNKVSEIPFDTLWSMNADQIMQVSAKKLDDPNPIVDCNSLQAQLTAIDALISLCQQDPNCSWSEQLQLIAERAQIIAQMHELECENIPSE